MIFWKLSGVPPRTNGSDLKAHRLVWELTCLMVCFALVAVSQTNVSGGVYANTTWLKSGSPYIVTDTIVVFPGVELKIEPGVTVKFADNAELEVRQGKLVCIGNNSDSIVFTSASTAPVKGSYGRILINGGALRSEFRYCRFSYARHAIHFHKTGYIPVVSQCVFSNNQQGVVLAYSQIGLDTCRFEKNYLGVFCLGGVTCVYNSCDFAGNDTGLSFDGIALVNKCSFRYNQKAVENGGFGDLVMSHSQLLSNGTGVAGNRSRVTNSVIRGNVNGIAGSGASVIDSCVVVANNFGVRGSTITNCTVDSNVTVGISIGTRSFINNNKIRYCGIGIDETYSGAPGDFNTIEGNIIEFDSIGLRIMNSSDIIRCNTLCNNKYYNVRYTLPGNSSGPFCAANSWCTTDSATIAASIYDGYDNIQLGLVNFMPLDISGCTAGLTKTALKNSFNLFPSPSTGNITIVTREKITGDIRIYDMRGRMVRDLRMENTDMATFELKAPGIYVLELFGDTIRWNRKFVIVEE